MILKTINTIISLSGMDKSYMQNIVTGVLLCFFIVLQSFILSRRSGTKFKIRIPDYITSLIRRKDDNAEAVEAAEIVDAGAEDAE